MGVLPHRTAGVVDVLWKLMAGNNSSHRECSYVIGIVPIQTIKEIKMIHIVLIIAMLAFVAFVVITDDKKWSRKEH